MKRKSANRILMKFFEELLLIRLRRISKIKLGLCCIAEAGLCCMVDLGINDGSVVEVLVILYLGKK